MTIEEYIKKFLKLNASIGLPIEMMICPKCHNAINYNYLHNCKVKEIVNNG
jgi:hypothetical protein